MFRLIRMGTAAGLFLFCTPAIALTAGCSEEVIPEESSLAPPKVAIPSSLALAALEKADAADGTIDKVVSKCVTCKLSMEGKSEYAAAYGEYRLHLCSDHCRKYFEKDQEKPLLNLQ